ncbi:MAG: hypothetical protein M3R01_13135 [Actinomycetota bacterium]|nr:hypothetical protein [Actinomycetota bacterium]
MSFDLRAAVNAALDTAGSPDPVIVADEVAQSIPTRAVREALSQSLRVYVSQQVMHRRAQSAELNPPRTGNGSGRWRAAASLLDQPFAVADGWKFLRDCTADDIMAGVDRRRSNAAGMLREAERFEALASLMVARGAATVADLGEPDAQGVLAA